MEYVHMRGSFDDMPLADIVADFARLYPRTLAQRDGTLGRADFATDVERETR
jgi:hypothetical protein